jgi:hypothetical protein
MYETFRKPTEWKDTFEMVIHETALEDTQTRCYATTAKSENIQSTFLSKDFANNHVSTAEIELQQ